jgi:hypothetical protein
MATELENTIATPGVNKPVVTKTKTSPKAKVAPKVTTEKTNEVTKAIKAEAKKVVNTAKKVTTEIKKDTQKVVENVKDMVEDSTVSKIIETGKKTTKILTTAGEKLFNSSLKSTKAIANIYTKAGKKALSLGKDLYAETSKVMTDNQKVMKDTSVKAFKDAVETIQESHIIDLPFKNRKNKKK